MTKKMTMVTCPNMTSAAGERRKKMRVSGPRHLWQPKDQAAAAVLPVHGLPQGGHRVPQSVGDPLQARGPIQVPSGPARRAVELNVNRRTDRGPGTGLHFWAWAGPSPGLRLQSGATAPHPVVAVWNCFGDSSELTADRTAYFE